MKHYRCLPNKSDGIFFVSFPYQSRIVSVSFSYHPPIILLLRSGKQYGMERKTNE